MMVGMMEKTRVDKANIWPHGLWSVSGLFGLRFSENLMFLFCVVYIYIVKTIDQSYQDNARTSVYMFTVAMETLTNEAKM